MNHSAIGQVGIYLALLIVLAWPLGLWLQRLLDGTVSARWPLLAATERGVMRLIGADPAEQMAWWRYAQAIVLFNVIGVLSVYLLQRVQVWLPFNPDAMAAVTPDSSFNTAVSFVTNTNWQGYAGESTMSHLTQMLALTVQNFTSAATGVAVAVALVRAFTKRSATIGNAWLDLWRVTVGCLLPLSFLFALFLIGQGVIQNFDASRSVDLIDPVTYSSPQLDETGKPRLDAQGQPMTQVAKADRQVIPMGPVASQEAIKMLGTNGGGFFNANSSHPFENPTPLSNFAQMLSIFLIPAALVFMFGAMVGDMRQGMALLGAMTLIFVAMLAVVIWSDSHANPTLASLGVDQTLGNLEGKETRFGVLASAMFATITTSASCGAVNAMHDSLMPLGGGAVMWLIQLGEVVFGGVGSGLYGMLVFAIQAVFLAGLMIGRTPEYLGKKIASFEMKMVAISILITPLLVLCGAALAVMTDSGRAGVLNPGAHGFSEILYALSSAANNNGSAFAGLTVNTPFYNVLLAVAMWFGRFGMIVPVLAIAGSLAAKPKLAVSSGTMPTNDGLFVALLIGVVILVGALTYVPALALGPVIEHLQLFASGAHALQ